MQAMYMTLFCLAAAFVQDIGLACGRGDGHGGYVLGRSGVRRAGKRPWYTGEEEDHP